MLPTVQNQNPLPIDAAPSPGAPAAAGAAGDDASGFAQVLQRAKAEPAARADRSAQPTDNRAAAPEEHTATRPAATPADARDTSPASKPAARGERRDDAGTRTQAHRPGHADARAAAASAVASKARDGAAAAHAGPASVGDGDQQVAHEAGVDDRAADESAGDGDPLSTGGAASDRRASGADAIDPAMPCTATPLPVEPPPPPSTTPIAAPSSTPTATAANATAAEQATAPSAAAVTATVTATATASASASASATPQTPVTARMPAAPTTQPAAHRLDPSAPSPGDAEAAASAELGIEKQARTARGQHDARAAARGDALARARGDATPAATPATDVVQRLAASGHADGERLQFTGREARDTIGRVASAFGTRSSEQPGIESAAAGGTIARHDALHAAATPAGERPAPHAALHTAVDDAAFGPMLGAQVALWVRDGVQEAQLRLHPAELGPVTVQIALDGNAAQVDFTAAAAATRSSIEQSLPALAAALRELGFTLTGGGVHDRTAGDGAPRQPRRDGGDARGRVGAIAGDLEPAAGRDAARRVSRSLLDLYA